jgi:hypothetical protein
MLQRLGKVEFGNELETITVESHPPVPVPKLCIMCLRQLVTLLIPAAPPSRSATNCNALGLRLNLGAPGVFYSLSFVQHASVLVCQAS